MARVENFVHNKRLNRDYWPVKSLERLMHATNTDDKIYSYSNIYKLFENQFSC